MILFLFLVILAILTYYLAIKPLNPLIKLKLQYGSKAKLQYFPVLGDLILMFRDSKKHNDALHTSRFLNTSAGKPQIQIRLTNIFATPLIGLSDPEYYKLVLQEHEKYEKFDVVGHNGLMAKGLIYSNEIKWKNQRALFGASFHFDALRQRMPLMNQVVDQRLSELKSKDPELLHLMNSITGDVVQRSFFGEDIINEKIRGQQLYLFIVNLFNNLSELQIGNVFVLVKQLLFGYKSWNILPIKQERDLISRINEIRFVCEKLVQKRIMTHALKQDSEGNTVIPPTNNFLDIYVKAYLEQNKADKNGISVDEIVQQFITLSFAGTDTTANLCAICLIYFAQNQQDQAEILEEIQNVVKDEDVEDKHLKYLVKLTAFINEVLRVRNPAICPILRIVKEDHYIKDLFVKRGWYINIDNMTPQMSEKHYENPTQFDYKRWLRVNSIKEDNQFVYVPFSAGGRNCIGQHMALMETKIILAKVLRKFKVIMKPNIEIRWIVSFLYTFEQKQPIIFEERSKQ